MKTSQSAGELLEEVNLLRSRLDEAEETLRAIRSGEVDALVVSGAQGEQVFSRRGAEHIYRVLIEQMSDGAAALTPEGIVLYGNRRLAALLRTPLERLLGRSMLGYVKPTDRPTFQNLLHLAVGDESHGDITLVADDGALIPVLISFGSIVFQDKQSLCMSITDITQRQQFEAELKQAKLTAEQANRELAIKNAKLCELNETAHRFVDDVSHEFRTPLTVIKEFALIIQDGLAGPVTDQQREYLDIVSLRVDDLGHMVDDMLDTSRLEAGLLGVCRRRCTIGELFDSVRPTLQRRAESRKIRLQFHNPCEFPIIYCDPEKTARVIINLTINALKFSEEGQLVRVASDWSPGDECVRISVTDQGPGIDPGSVGQLFKRFTQIDGATPRGAKGFGLGLSIAHELVQLSFGDISLESEVGAGSTFTFTIPTAEMRPLLARYWDRVQHYRDGLQFSSMLRAACESQEPRAIAEITEFLQRQIRRTDLVFPARDGGWILVFASNNPDLKPLLSRFSHALQEVNRNRPSHALPEVTYEVLGCWTMPEDLESFQAGVEESVEPPPRTRDDSERRAASTNGKVDSVFPQPQARWAAHEPHESGSHHPTRQCWIADLRASAERGSLVRTCTPSATGATSATLHPNRTSGRGKAR